MSRPTEKGVNEFYITSLFFFSFFSFHSVCVLLRCAFAFGLIRGVWDG